MRSEDVPALVVLLALIFATSSANAVGASRAPEASLIWQATVHSAKQRGRSAFIDNGAKTGRFLLNGAASANAKPPISSSNNSYSATWLRMEGLTGETTDELWTRGSRGIGDAINANESEGP